MFSVTTTHIEVLGTPDVPSTLISWLKRQPDVQLGSNGVFAVYRLPRDRSPGLRAFMAEHPGRDVAEPNVFGPGADREIVVRRPSLPDGFRLYPHQASGVDFLASRYTAMLADDMGLGKTIQAAIASLAVRDGGKVLVLAPAFLQRNWLKELNTLGVHARVQTRSDFSIGAAMYSIASIDSAKMKGDLRDALLKQHWAVVIVDEAQYVKGLGNARNNFVCSLVATHRWLLTGTPMLNRPMDVLGMLAAANHPMALDDETFRERFDLDKEELLNASAALGLELSDWILRRHKRDVLDLPDKHRELIYCPTSDFAPSSRGELMRNRAELALEKIDATLSVVTEAIEDGRGAVVFSNFRKPLDAMLAELKRYGLTAELINGDVPMKKRSEIEARFQAGTTRVLLGQIRSCGVGLNLTRATTVVTNDLSFVPADHLQADDRAHRIGQDSEVSTYYILSDCALDEANWELLERKRGYVGAFEEAIGKDTAEIDPDELLAEIARKCTVTR